MNKDTLASNWFNTAYDETYKDWLRSNIQCLSFSIPNSYRNVKDKKSKVVIELIEVKREVQETHNKFLQYQCSLENATRELE